MSFDFDTLAFERYFDQVAGEAPAAFEKGAALAGMRVLRDAVMQAPTVPIDTGTLRASLPT